MSGIGGIFAYHYAANPISRSELARISQHMAARGPDGAGDWFSADGRVGFAHRRLVILDLTDAAAQPMPTADGAQIIAFDGAIYNHRELRRRLEGREHVFRSHSDAEVLLRLYADKGEAMVRDLRGMFAFALWDVARRTLFLARDPSGVKPLFYADDGWTFRFASQVKALLAGGAVSRDPEPAGRVGFYLCGGVPEPFTSYQAIRALPAGATMIVNDIGSHEARRYQSIAHIHDDEAADAQARPSHVVGSALNPAQAEAILHEALLDSVRRHLIADAPVAALLLQDTGSAFLAALLRDVGQPDVPTVSLAFEDRADAANSGAQGRDAARLIAPLHTQRIVTKSEFEADLPLLLEAMDQPSIDGLEIWFAAKAARQQGFKVAICGLGADFLAPGQAPIWMRGLEGMRRVPGTGPLARWLGRASGGFGGKLLPHGLYRRRELSDVLDPDMIAKGLARLGSLTASALAEGVRARVLRDADWASMAHSVEVHLPFADSVLLRKIADALNASPHAKLWRAANLSAPMVHDASRMSPAMAAISKWAPLASKPARSGHARPGEDALRQWARYVDAV